MANVDDDYDKYDDDDDENKAHYIGVPSIRKVTIYKATL
jgi:hypothetical protein